MKNDGKPIYRWKKSDTPGFGSYGTEGRWWTCARGPNGLWIGRPPNKGEAMLSGYKSATKLWEAICKEDGAFDARKLASDPASQVTPSWAGAEKPMKNDGKPIYRWKKSDTPGFGSYGTEGRWWTCARGPDRRWIGRPPNKGEAMLSGYKSATKLWEAICKEDGAFDARKLAKEATSPADASSKFDRLWRDNQQDASQDDDFDEL